MLSLNSSLYIECNFQCYYIEIRHKYIPTKLPMIVLYLIFFFLTHGVRFAHVNFKFVVIFFRVSEIIPTLQKALQVAQSGTPGTVAFFFLKFLLLLLLFYT